MTISSLEIEQWPEHRGKMGPQVNQAQRISHSSTVRWPMSLKHSSRSSTAAIVIHVGILQTHELKLYQLGIIGMEHVEYVDVAPINNKNTTQPFIK